MSHLDDNFDAEGGDSQQPGSDWEELPEIDHQDERSHHQENADACKIKFIIKIWETARPEKHRWLKFKKSILTTEILGNKFTKKQMAESWKLQISN